MVMLALLQSDSEAFKDAFKLLGVGVAAGAGVIVAGAEMRYLIGQTIASIHRQPQAFEQIRTLMFLGIGLVETQALFASSSPSCLLSSSREEGKEGKKRGRWWNAP